LLQDIGPKLAWVSYFPRPTEEFEAIPAQISFQSTIAKFEKGVYLQAEDVRSSLGNNCVPNLQRTISRTHLLRLRRHRDAPQRGGQAKYLDRRSIEIRAEEMQNINASPNE